MTWDQEMLARLEAPAAWSRARIRAEAEWAEIWRGRNGFAVVRNRVVTVERRRRPALKEAA
jgi:hypothetical protein